MSVSNGIWIRQIGGKWYVKYGYDTHLELNDNDLNEWFQSEPEAICDSRKVALVAAHDEAANRGYLEYNVAEV